MKGLFYLTLLSLPILAMAETHQVTGIRYAGPYRVNEPLKVDSADVNGKAYDAQSLLDIALDPKALRQGTMLEDEALPTTPQGLRYALHQVGFTLTNTEYGKVELKLDKAPANYRMTLDGKPSGPGELQLEPGDHEVVIRYLSDTTGHKTDSLKVSYRDSTMRVTCGVTGDVRQRYTIQRMMTSLLTGSPTLSAHGDWMMVRTYSRDYKRGERYLLERATGRRVAVRDFDGWMPRTNRYYYTRTGLYGQELVTVDPATGQEEVLADCLPNAPFDIAPTEDYLIYTDRVEGPKELNADVREVLNPEDRQPGWRQRRAYSILDLKTGVKRPMTFGKSSYWLYDVSSDGRYWLVGKGEHSFGSLGEGQPVDRPLRPHEWTSFYRIDIQTMAVDTLIEKDGFVGQVSFAPNGKQLLVMGSPEAFDRKGCTLPAEVVPSMYDYQLYLMDIDTREVRPMTRDFAPSIAKPVWSEADGMIYFTANNRDSVSLYRMEPVSGNIIRMDLPEEVVKQFDLASGAKVMALTAQSAMNGDRMYTIDLDKLPKPKTADGTLAMGRALRMVMDVSARNLEDVQVAMCKAWTFGNSVGDEVLCRYYVPVGYTEQADGQLTCDSTGAKVEGTIPMITYYYGGCSPTERNFESSYPWQCWAALGYAVLVVQPSGAAGFGQEWAARHVNTAGVDPARDIMEAVREFARTHAYINKEKVGCCGASYGGFMTQYMQTLPDCPFACAISHAGISDHTTYWGYGYWGYSYSEVSMANSYPWSEMELYVKNSPIYNVDKITTPILFLHGTQDVNVPINNSIQMFTALKLLGRETALVCVEGEDHGVVDYDKRMAWLKTQLAWFQKYLKDDSSWWDALYPKKAL